MRSGWDRTGPGPGSPRSPADERASRAAAGWSRARSSGRQSLSTAGPPGGDDAAAARRPHPGAEAVLLGAMALLGLVGLLHRACARSSPLGLGSTSDPERHANAPGARERVGAFVVRRMIGRARSGCQTSRGRPDAAPEAASAARRGRYSRGVSQNRLATAVPAVLSSPSPRRRDARGSGPSDRRIRVLGATSRLAEDRSESSATLASPSPALRLRDHSSPAQAGSPSTNGRQAGLARRPRRAAGLPVAGQLRDVAARHAARRRRRPALPDRASRTASPRTGSRPATGR